MGTRGEGKEHYLVQTTSLEDSGSQKYRDCFESGGRDQFFLLEQSDIGAVVHWDAKYGGGSVDNIQ